MTGENRVLLLWFTSLCDPRPGIKALVHQVKQTLDITDVVLSSHQINAAGHQTGNHAVELLTI
jgi:hypothetical protein